MKKPVLLLIFNRLDTTQRVFEEIRKAKPPRLYIASDAARVDRDGEDVIVRNVRNYVTSHIDWDCKVKTLFRERNLGCRESVSGAITWFFEQEEDGIILEDDCFPHQSFFNFCEELLDYYRDNKRIMHISGNQFVPNYDDDSSYYFAKIMHCWGWAGWADRWQKNYGSDLKDYSEENLYKFSHIKAVQNYWLGILNKMKNAEIDSWAYQWTFKIVEQEGLCINPSKNLISNIGFGEDATHTSDTDHPFANLPIYDVGEIIHPRKIELDESAVNYIYKNNYHINVEPKIALFTSLLRGGAGSAAVSIHGSLLKNHIDSQIITRSTEKALANDVPNCKYIEPDIGLAYDEIQSSHNYKKQYTLFSLNEPKLFQNTIFNLVKNSDIINLHWTARFLTAEDIGYLSSLGKPVVIVVHDVNPLTGGCHAFHKCTQWKNGCKKCPQLLNDHNNFPEKIFHIKEKYWNTDNITIIALSNCSKKIIKKSPIFKKCRVEVIALPIDLHIFSPMATENISREIGINRNVPTVLFLPSYTSAIKGANEFRQSLSLLKKNHPEFDMQVIVAGAGAATIKNSEYPYKVFNLGLVSGRRALAEVYSMASVTVIPSHEETFSLTAAESVSCGTPIVGFDVGAIKEISGNGRGECVETGKIVALSEAIYRALNNDGNEMGDRCRTYAMSNFSYEEQGKRYANLFNDLIVSQKIYGESNSSIVPTIEPSIFTDLLTWYAKSVVRSSKSNCDTAQIEGKSDTNYKNELEYLRSSRFCKMREWYLQLKSKVKFIMLTPEECIKKYLVLILNSRMRQPMRKIWYAIRFRKSN